MEGLAKIVQHKTTLYSSVHIRSKLAVETSRNQPATPCLHWRCNDSDYPHFNNKTPQGKRDKTCSQSFTGKSISRHLRIFSPYSNRIELLRGPASLSDIFKVCIVRELCSGFKEKHSSGTAFAFIIALSTSNHNGNDAAINVRRSYTKA